ncbi:unnamed protein product, partial [Dovyalis caffra]
LPRTLSLLCQNGHRRPFQRNKKPICTYRNNPGHMEDKCYKKHGFPPNFSPMPRSNQHSSKDYTKSRFKAAHQVETHFALAFENETPVSISTT